MKHLRDSYLDELFKLALKKKEVLEMCVQHLEYHYIPIESYKLIWQKVRTHYVNKNTVPSIGYIAQSFDSNSDSDMAVQDVLANIRKLTMPDSAETIEALQEFIKDAMSLEFFDKYKDKYNEGDREGARVLLRETGERIANFSIIKGTTFFKKVFAGFSERNDERYYDYNMRGGMIDKIPIGIDELDIMTSGGMDVTDTLCMIMRSGAGKTKFLRHMGVGAARRGRSVLHLQAEGSEAECTNGYDATWSACFMSDIKKGSIDPNKYKELQKIVNNISGKGGEIYVHAYEQFNQASMADVRILTSDLISTVGSVDLIIGDYLELFDPADGRRYGVNDERHRRIAVANKMKNIAVEFQTRFATATQANDIPPKLLEDPGYVITRHNTSECKGLANPFSHFLTGNQTREEYHDGVMRIFADKIRHHKSDKVVKIYQEYSRDRFYDKKRTLAEQDNDGS